MAQQNGLNLPIPVPASSGGTGLTSYQAGQVLVGNSSNQITALGAGSTGQVLTADTTKALGLGWTTPAASSTTAVILGYYFTGVTKWLNSRQVNVPNYYLADSTGQIYIANTAATIIDCTKVNVDGGMAVSSALPGTITVFANNISGTNTTFTTSFQVGDTIYLPSYSQSRKIVQINSNTEMLTDSGENFSFADWYVVSNAPTISTAQSKFGGSSLSFSGAQTADMYSYFSSSSIHQYEFTVESFFYFNSLSTSAVTALFNGLSSYTYTVQVNQSGKLSFAISSNGTSYDIASAVAGTTSVATGTWHHIALTYYYGVYTVWLNGRAEISVSSTSAVVSTALNAFRIGNIEGGSSNYLSGYVDESRISGCARYLATFTPPTAAFVADAYTLSLNHWDGANGAVDLNLSEVMRPSPVRWNNTYYGSPALTTAQSKFGGSSMLNSATSGVLVETGITQGIVPAQHCTEFWVMPTAVGTNSTILDTIYAGYTYNLNLTSSKVVYSIGNNGTSANIATGTSSTTLVNGTWYHIALSFDGSNYRLFVNGSLQAATATTTQPSSQFARAFAFGCTNSKASGTAGYYNEFRFSSAARYTAAFTPATTAFTVDASTVVLNHLNGPNGSLFIQDGEAVGATTYCRGGLARNTHYYPYAISNGTTSQLRLSTRCLSYGDTFTDLPSGYTYLRQLRFVVSTNANTNVNMFQIAGNLISYPYNDDSGSPIGFAGAFAIGSGLTSTSFATLSTINLVPKISQEALICSYIWNNTTTDSAVKVRYTGSVSPNGTTVCQATNQYINGSVTKTTAHVNDCYVPLSSGQQFDYKVTTSGCQCGFLVKGYKITEV